ncbi:MAG: glycerol-3-phosphate acyltransferase, partial [Armatimonadota bacterium]
MNPALDPVAGGSVNVTAILLFIGAYILGAIPFGVLIAKAQAGVDIMKVGSGNIGATNVHRQLGWKASVPVLLLDICKGLVPPIIARALHLSWPPNLSEIDIALMAGFAAVLGHCASPFLKFKGGKGIATICGATIGATPLVAVAGISAFILATLITRYISVGSIIAVLAAAVAAWALHYDVWVVAAYGAI